MPRMWAVGRSHEPSFARPLRAILHNNYFCSAVNTTGKLVLTSTHKNRTAHIWQLRGPVHQPLLFVSHPPTLQKKSTDARPARLAHAFRDARSVLIARISTIRPTPPSEPRVCRTAARDGDLSAARAGVLALLLTTGSATGSHMSERQVTVRAT